MKKTAKKIVIVLLLLLLIGWILMYFFCPKKDMVTGNLTSKDAVTTLEQNANKVTNSGFRFISDDITLKSEKGFDFPVNSAESMQPYSQDLDESMLKAVNYLKDNANKQLNIIGRYQAEEKNETAFADLGLARAESIKAQFVKLGVNPEQIKVVSKAYPEAVANQDKQYLGMIDFDVITKEEIKVATNKGFSAMGDGFELKGQNGFNFAIHSDKVIKPYPTDLEENLAKVVSFLKENPANQITVVGRYQADEENKTLFPNLGLARSQKIKDQLINLGVNSQQLVISGQVDNNAVADDKGQYLGMIDFAVKKLDEQATNTRKQEMKNLLLALNEKPLTLYFGSDSTQITLSDAEKERFVKIVEFLDYAPRAQALITGHTDSSGSSEQNMIIGKERAQFAANYLTESGLHKNQIIVDSKGADAPIADNNTEEGKAKNRRVTITINTNEK